jgi:glycine hydroxymethyltransferase
VREDLSEVDPDTDLIIRIEEERQARRLIMIPSESTAPAAVLRALGSAFNNVYAEGYPPLRMTRDEVDEILDYKWQLARYRRLGDRRFYKGDDYVHFIECLAQRRCAQCFATPEVPAERIFVNVQPLSGAAANNVVYEAFVKPGATVMGMALAQGGHLTHGSELNRSGKLYRIVPYAVSHQTGRLSYDAILKLALEHKPKMIIAGYTSYTWAPDWAKFREICDAVGDCILMADVAHPAGMIVAGEFPNPIGYADVITFTTHKTLCGPRAAVILTTDEAKAAMVDQTVFPGEQGGPHVNKFAAMAVTFKIAQTEKFRRLQRQIKVNARHLAESLEKQGVGLAYGGTDTHFCMADLHTVKSKTGFPLMGEIAARMLEFCGIVANKNTIPGDTSAADASGVRLGTPWITQRGFKEPEIERLAEIIADVFQHIEPFTYLGPQGVLPRGKMALDAFERLKAKTQELIEDTMTVEPPARSGYPHHYWMGSATPATTGAAELPEDVRAARSAHPLFDCGDVGLLAIRGQHPRAFIQNVVTSDVFEICPGGSAHTFLLDENGVLMDDVLVLNRSHGTTGRYLIVTHAPNHERVKAWLRGHSDGYVVFDREDIFRKIEGPVVVDDLADESADPQERVRPIALKRNPNKARIKKRRQAGLPVYQEGDRRPSGLQLCTGHHRDKFALWKPYFIGQRPIERVVKLQPKPRSFEWSEPERELRRTPLFDDHRKRARKLVPFAGWEMPLWYSGIADEHAAVRRAAGLFDVGHMGIIEIAGERAFSFLDAVTTNEVRQLDIGQSQYAYILDPDGLPMDDVLVYRRGPQRFMMVVNAANAAKVWAWLSAVNSREVVLDRDYPHRDIGGSVTLRDLGDRSAGGDQLMDLALQGPASAEVLRRLRGENRVAGPLAALPKFGFIEDEVAGIPAIISRTGYTGEAVGFELYVHPANAVRLWNLLLEAGGDLGVKPAGLGARDSTRIEAGLPLYGHELAGPESITPAGAGYGAFVKLHKPFFVGREALMAREKERRMEVIRFRLDRKGGRAVRTGDLVADKHGSRIGSVTSCALVEGFQLGMAYVDCNSTRPGTPIAVFPQSAEAQAVAASGSPPVAFGARMPLHESATVLTRFPQ